jgi:hypothetical protein
MAAAAVRRSLQKLTFVFPRFSTLQSESNQSFPAGGGGNLREFTPISSERGKGLGLVAGWPIPSGSRFIASDFLKNDLIPYFKLITRR